MDIHKKSLLSRFAGYSPAMWSPPGYYMPLPLQYQYPNPHYAYPLQHFGYTPAPTFAHPPQYHMPGYATYNLQPSSPCQIQNYPLVHFPHPQYISVSHNDTRDFTEEFLLDTLDSSDVDFNTDTFEHQDHVFFNDRLTKLQFDTKLPAITILPCPQCNNSIDISLNELSIPPAKPISNEIRTCSSLSILPSTLKSPLSVTNNTSHSTPATIDDYLEDYRIFITIFLTAWRSGEMTDVTHDQLSALFESPEFKRLDQRFLYSNHGALLTSLDGLSFNGFTTQWIFKPPP